MSECPVCRQQIEIPEASRGTLFTCPRCNAVYFVSWDGAPETPPSEEEMNATPEPAAFENPPEISVEAPMEQEWAAPEPAVGSDFSIEEDVTVDGSVVTTEGVPVELAAADFPEATPDYDFNQPLGDNPLFTPQPQAPEPLAMADAPSFEDVADFGNSDTAVGPLAYTVIIEGIDTGKIYGELKEALDDSRFRWNVPEILKTIQAGRLEIRDLNPAKAFVLVNRIKYLSLKISWRQDVLS